MPDPIRFDVFGTLMDVERQGGTWRLYLVAGEGRRQDVSNIVIPRGLEEGELLRYLADLFHEGASPDRPDVIRLTGPGEQPRGDA